MSIIEGRHWPEFVAPDRGVDRNVSAVGTLADSRLMSIATNSIDLVILRGLVERAEGRWPLSLQQQQLDQLVYVRDLLSEFAEGK